jgi:hypothetical protein
VASISPIIAQNADLGHKEASTFRTIGRNFADVIGLLSYAPVAAAAFAVPQFAPQIRRLRSTGDTAGVSWSWAALTCVNNAAWTAYFALARYWTALVPSVSVAVLAGLLAIMLTGTVRVGTRPALLTIVWSALLVMAWTVGGGASLGTLLTAGFIVQVTPPLWNAYLVVLPTGVSAGTWLLIFAELACWLLFGVHESDPRLITLGTAGVFASTLMLARIRHAASRRPGSPVVSGVAEHRLRALWPYSRGNQLPEQVSDAGALVVEQDDDAGRLVRDPAGHR